MCRNYQESPSEENTGHSEQVRSGGQEKKGKRGGRDGEVGEQGERGGGRRREERKADRRWIKSEHPVEHKSIGKFGEIGPERSGLDSPIAASLHG